jgi:hypothetical protein
MQVAQFLVDELNKKDSNKVKVLVEVEEAETQIVNGIKYYLKLKLADNRNGMETVQLSATRGVKNNLYINA